MWIHIVHNTSTHDLENFIKMTKNHLYHYKLRSPNGEKTCNDHLCKRKDRSQCGYCIRTDDVKTRWENQRFSTKSLRIPLINFQKRCAFSKTRNKAKLRKWELNKKPRDGTYQKEKPAQMGSAEGRWKLE